MNKNKNVQLPTINEATKVDKWLANQAANRAKIDKRIEDNKHYPYWKDYTQHTTEDYHFINRNVVGVHRKEYIPKLVFDVVKPHTINAKLIFKQILINKGYTGKDFGSLIATFYGRTEFSGVVNDKVVAYLKDGKKYHFVTEDDYIDYVDNNKSAKPKRVAKFKFEVDNVYEAEASDPLGASSYIVITEVTAMQAKCRFLHKKDDIWKDTEYKKYIVLINGEAVEYCYVSKSVCNIRLDINCNWCCNDIYKVNRQPVGYNMAVWREKQIDSILDD